MTATEPAATIPTHAFVGDDPNGPCTECHADAAHPAHRAATPDTRAAASPPASGPVHERQPLDPADGLAAATAPPAAVDVDNYDDGDAAVHLDGIQVDDLDWATWAARKRHRVEQRIAERAELAADQHARINAWLEGEAARLQRDLTFFESLLHGFHQRALATDPKNAKTIRLPDGTELSSQAGKLAVTVTDIKAFEGWAERNELTEELLRFPDPEPKKAEIAKRFDSKAVGETEPGDYPAVDAATGEVVPGVEITRRPRSFTVKGPADEDKH